MPTKQHATLLVEDDPVDAHLTVRAFRKAGFENPVHVVQTSSLAMKYLKGEAPYNDPLKFPAPHLVIMDGSVPGGTEETILWIRKNAQLKNLPIVVFSGSENPSHEQRALELGANAYYVKPLDFEEFAARIRTIAEFWLRSFIRTKE